MTHLNFFENVVKDTKKEKFLIFNIKKKMSQKEIWEDIKTKLIDLKPFYEKINSKYLNYMVRLEDGFNGFYNWFIEDENSKHKKIIYHKLANAGDEKILFYFSEATQSVRLTVDGYKIIFPSDALESVNLLEWILTDTEYKIYREVNEQGSVLKKELHWFANDLEELVEKLTRAFYEYYGIHNYMTILEESLAITASLKKPYWE